MWSFGVIRAAAKYAGRKEVRRINPAMTTTKIGWFSCDAEPLLYNCSLRLLGLSLAERSRSRVAMWRVARKRRRRSSDFPLPLLMFWVLSKKNCTMDVVSSPCPDSGPLYLSASRAVGGAHKRCSKGDLKKHIQGQYKNTNGKPGGITTRLLWVGIC